MQQFLFFILLLVGGVNNVTAQTNSRFKRALFHEWIDTQQKRADAIDEDVDNQVSLTQAPSLNANLSMAIITLVDSLQERIERYPPADHNTKVRYLRGLEYMLKSMNDAPKSSVKGLLIAPVAIQAFEQAWTLDRSGKSIVPALEPLPWNVAHLVMDSKAFSQNKQLKAAKEVVLLKYVDYYPERTLLALRELPDIDCADSLIQLAAYASPRRLYDFAAANDALGLKIKNHPDSLVQSIVAIASSKKGQLYLPFLDALHSGRISIAEIDQVIESPKDYFRLMVQTRLDYANRLANHEKLLEANALSDMMTKKVLEVYVREINALHEQPDGVRFRITESMMPEELYYVLVLGESEIYTSSYLGVYKRMMAKLPVARGDSLLMRMHFDFFRKFIKMAAGYNTLDPFLATMNKANSNATMMAFVRGLEQGVGIEEAVDVADSYASLLNNKTLRSQMRTEVDASYEENKQAENKRGEVIYRLLSVLFSSSDSSRKVDVSAELGIPPVYNVPFTSLADDSGRVVQQVFFYGDEDKDGQNSFINFMGMFRGKPQWRIAENENWVTISSTTGKKVFIYANKPLLGDDDPDAKAQAQLINYLKFNQLKPTVVIHRGHSYHVKYTIDQLAPSAKIVVLGSCGGYHNLDNVLEISPDAHIISSKQIGTKVVNEPILQAINESVRSGKDVEWIPMWNGLSRMFTGEAKERFDDYVPPHKNLGAIFIKAYKKAMGTE